MEEPQELEDVIQTFDPNSGDYYACGNCRTPIALHQHLLPSPPGMLMDDRTFSDAINVRTNSPAEDYIVLHCTRTNVYCNNCNLILGIKFIQVAEDRQRPIVGEFSFIRVGNFDPNFGDHYACWNCHTHIALQSHILPISHEMLIGHRAAFSEAINVHTNSPEEDQFSALHNVTSTSVYCNICNLILGIKFIQVGEGRQRPIVNEVIFDRPRLVRITV